MSAQYRVQRNKRVIGETLSILDANAGQLSQTSRETSIPITTLHGWREIYKNDPEVESYRKLKNEELADRFRVVAAKAIERLNAEIGKVSIDKLATVAAISTDKQLLLTGQATSITKKQDDLLSSARSAFILTALPELQQSNPNWSESQLKQAAEERFQAWFDSLNLSPVVTEATSENN